MDAETMLKTSRKENENRDLTNSEIGAQAGNIAANVGAATCWVLSIVFYVSTGISLLSPWIIYFSIFGTYYLVKFIKAKRKANLVLAILYYVIGLFALILFVLRIIEVRG